MTVTAGRTARLRIAGDPPDVEVGRPLRGLEPTRGKTDAQRLVAQERDRIRSSWLAGVLGSRDPQSGFDPALTQFLGIDTGQAFLVLAARPEKPLDHIRPADVWWALRGSSLRASGFLTTPLEDVYTFVVRRPVPADPDSDRRYIERTVRALLPVLGRHTVTGIGRVAQTGRDVPASVAEARLAIDMPRGDAAIVYIDEVNIFGLLSLIRDEKALEKFADDNIGPLKNEVDLLATLQVLLDCNFTVATAARRMHVHYNTMRYRLERLVQILGPIEHQPQRLLAIQLALYIRKMLPPTRID